MFPFSIFFFPVFYFPVFPLLSSPSLCMCYSTYAVWLLADEWVPCQFMLLWFFFFPVRGMRREEWWKGAAVGESEPRRRSKAVQTCTMSQGCYCPVHFFFSSCYLLFGFNFISCSGAGVCVHVRTSRELREGKRALSMSARLTYSVPTFFFFRLRYLRFWLASAERSVLQAALLKLKRQEGEQWGRLKSTPRVFFLLLVNRAFFIHPSYLSLAYLVEEGEKWVCGWTARKTKVLRSFFSLLFLLHVEDDFVALPYFHTKR